MKLLLDQGLPRSAVGLLRRSGHHAVHVGEIGLSAAADSVILERALTDGCVVVTLDADFHTLLSLAEATGPSVVGVRIEGLRAKALADLLSLVLSRCSEELEKGAVVTVQAGRFRIRRLPLVP